MMIQQMDLAGYTPEITQKTVYDDEGKASSYQNQIKSINDQIAVIQADLDANPPKPQPVGGKAPAKDPRQLQIESLQKDVFKAQSDLNKIPSRTYDDYKMVKKVDPREQDAIDKYGKDSPQVKQIQEQIKGEEVYSAEAKAQITKDYLDKAKKLVNGDYSYTDEQKAQTQKYFEPIQKVLNETTDMLMNEADSNQANLFEYVNKYMDQIDKTGIDTLDALNAALVQVEKSGAGLMNIVQEVNSKYEAKAKFEFDLLSKQADEKAANQSALLGLPPGSMVEKKQAAAMKYNALQSVLLGLEVNEAERTLGVASQTESEKKSISLAKADLALQQGGKKESLAGVGLDIAATTGQQKFGIKGAYAQNQLGLEQDKMNLLYNAAVGNLPSQVSGGQGVMGFDQAMVNGKMNQTATAMAPAQYGLGIEQQRTFQEAKTTTHKVESPSIASSVMGIVGGLASAAESVMSGVGAMGGGGGK